MIVPPDRPLRCSGHGVAVVHAERVGERAQMLRRTPHLHDEHISAGVSELARDHGPAHS